MRDRHEMILHQQRQQAPLSPYMSKAAMELPQETPEPPLLWPVLRHWWMIVLFGLIGVGAAMAYIRNAQPLYNSYAKIYIQPTPGAVVEFLGNNERTNYLATQCEVIASRPVLDRALALHPELRGLRTFIPAHGDPVSYLREELEVDLERRTDLIVVSMSSPWPAEAKQIVDAVVEAYTTDLERDRDEKSRGFLDNLKQTLAEEEARKEQIRKQIVQYMHEHPTASIRPESNNVDAENLRLIQARRTEKELELVTAEARWGSNHQNVKIAREQLAGIKRLEQTALEQLRVHKDASVGLAELQSILDQKADLTKKLSDRIHAQEMATSGRKLATVELVEPAQAANSPSFPRKNRTMAVAVAAGMLIGAGLALLRDRMDGRMRTIEEIQTVVGLPILGVVPGMTGRRTAIARAMAVHLDPRSPVAEAYRTIRTAVYFGANGSTLRTLLVTSPEPGDGKTTSASNLAIAIAQTGRSVLLLDADFRKPTQHKNLDVKDTIGLSSVLAGRESLERAIQRTGVEGLDILPCGPIPANPSEILNSREFGELVDTLVKRYDHVIFDSPPVNRVTDARILGAVVDATILVLRAGRSTRKAGEHARNALIGVGARILGAIVNGAPHTKDYAVYGGAYYGPTNMTETRNITTTPYDPHQKNEYPRRRNIA